MLQLDREIQLKKINFDLDNPRFLDRIGNSQDEIKNKLLKKLYTKELLKAMKEQLLYVNKIAVVKINESDDKYKVIEGNTRLACLKSGEIKGINEDSKIKVVELIRDKENGESEEEFELNLKLTQGIANVMVVKQWDAVSKAKYYWDNYNNLKKVNKNDSRVQLINKLSDSLGVKPNDVREGIMKYEFFRVINDTNETELQNNQYSFLAGICKNEKTRKFLGFDDKEYKFLWDKDDYEGDEDIEEKKERISKITELINSYDKDTQSFREEFSILVESNESSDNFNKLADKEVNWISIRTNSIDPVKEVNSVLSSSITMVGSISIVYESFKDNEQAKRLLKILESTIASKVQQLKILEGDNCE